MWIAEDTRWLDATAQAELVAACFFFNDTATTAIYTLSYTLSLHDALPIPGEAGLVLAPVAVVGPVVVTGPARLRSEEHTSELQSHSEISYAVFCLKKK